jgi:hypothetical protein
MLKKLLNLSLRILSVFFGAFLVFQGFTTFGFTAIISLFIETTSSILYAAALIAFSTALMAAGIIMIYEGLSDFVLTSKAFHKLYSKI